MRSTSEDYRSTSAAASILGTESDDQEKPQIYTASSLDIFKIVPSYLNYGNFRCSQLFTAPAPMETKRTSRTGREKREGIGDLSTGK